MHALVFAINLTFRKSGPNFSCAHFVTLNDLMTVDSALFSTAEKTTPSEFIYNQSDKKSEVRFITHWVFKQFRSDMRQTWRWYINDQCQSKTQVEQTRIREFSLLSNVHASNERSTEPAMTTEFARSRSVLGIESQARPNESHRTVNLEVSEFAISA